MYLKPMGLVQLATVLGGDAVDHAAGVEGAPQSPGHFLYTSNHSGEPQALVRIDKAPVFSYGADAVGIGRLPGRHAFLFHHGFLQQRNVRRIGSD